jgi:hypothetical protein
LTARQGLPGFAEYISPLVHNGRVNDLLEDDIAAVYCVVHDYGNS